MKTFSQISEVLTQCGADINPILARNGGQTHILCTDGDRKMKTKSKKNSEVRYAFKKLCSQILEILARCCDDIMSKLG